MSEGPSHQHLTSGIGHLDPAHRLQRQQGALVRLSWRGHPTPNRSQCEPDVRPQCPCRRTGSWQDSKPLLDIGWKRVEPEMVFSAKLRCRAMSDVGGKAEIICSF